jgi:hypothetical protein
VLGTRDYEPLWHSTFAKGAAALLMLRSLQAFVTSNEQDVSASDPSGLDRFGSNRQEDGCSRMPPLHDARPVG